MSKAQVRYDTASETYRLNDAEAEKVIKYALGTWLYRFFHPMGQVIYRKALPAIDNDFKKGAR